MMIGGNDNGRGCRADLVGKVERIFPDGRETPPLSPICDNVCDCAGTLPIF
jgi:hypothetical protein